MNFNITNYNYYYNYVQYHSIYYGSISSVVYVASESAPGLSVFDTNCNFLRYMSFVGYSPSYSLSYFNGNLYGDDGGSNVEVASKSTISFVAKYSTLCDYISSITFDSFGYMAVGCWYNQVALYNAYNGSYLNLQLATSNYPSFTVVDASGRLVSLSNNVIDIYY